MQAEGSPPEVSPLHSIWSYRDLKLCENNASKCYGGEDTKSDAPCITQMFVIDKIVDFNELTDNMCREDEVAVHCTGLECMYDGPIHMYNSPATINGEDKPLEYKYQCVNASSYFASKDKIPLCKKETNQNQTQYDARTQFSLATPNITRSMRIAALVDDIPAQMTHICFHKSDGPNFNFNMIKNPFGEREPMFAGCGSGSCLTTIPSDQDPSSLYAKSSPTPPSYKHIPIFKTHPRIPAPYNLQDDKANPQPRAPVLAACVDCQNTWRNASQEFLDNMICFRLNERY